MPPWLQLLMMLRGSRRWPLPSEEAIRRQVLRWAALRETDEPYLRALMKWPQDRPLILDNIAEKIASAYGDLLFGEDPQWTPADAADGERLDELVESWPAELPAAEETCVSEGEVWWRLSVNPALPHPTVTWHSRADVVPLLHGRNVIACAFVSRLPAPSLSGRRDQEVWRHIEIHGAGMVANTLWRGRGDVLGMQMDLGRHDATAALIDQWPHGLPMLAGRIVNRWGRRPACGVSVYHGVWTQFLTLHEATTIGRENMRLTAKKRAVVPASAVRPQPVLGPNGDARLMDRGDGTMVPVTAQAAVFDAGEDVLIHDPLDVDESRGDAGPFKVLEYSFDAQALIAYKRDVVETICQRCDIVPQWLGQGDFGAAESGTALRVRLIPTTNAAESRGRRWDGELPRITMLAQLLEQLDIPQGGIGRREWVNAAGAPAVERQDTLPQDETEVAARHATLKTADLISTEQSIRERHPDWDDDAVTKEVERIRADIEATMPAASGFGGGPVPPPPAPPGA
jgi:hypothetical protein